MGQLFRIARPDICGLIHSRPAFRSFRAFPDVLRPRDAYRTVPSGYSHPSLKIKRLSRRMRELQARL